MDLEDRDILGITDFVRRFPCNELGNLSCKVIGTLSITLPPGLYKARYGAPDRDPCHWSYNPRQLDIGAPVSTEHTR
jgi:hypothetical protein